MRAVEPEGAHELRVVVELPDRRGRDRLVGGGGHRVRPRVRREPHARAAHEVAQLCEALAKRFAPRIARARVRGERHGVRGHAKDPNVVSVVPAEDRLERVEVRRQELTQALGRRLREARRTRRAPEERVEAGVAEPEPRLTRIRRHRAPVGLFAPPRRTASARRERAWRCRFPARQSRCGARRRARGPRRPAPASRGGARARRGAA